MLIVSKFGRARYGAWLLLLSVVSLVACVVVTGSDAAAAFYLSPTRAWELMVGSLLAVNALPALKDQRARELVAFAGIAMLGVSVLTFPEFTIFPGMAALLPVLGTAMLIHAGAHGETVVGRCLSVRPMVFVGLISYSLYLWHWPVIVFAQYYSVVALTPSATILVLCVTFALAIASWRYVETPFRRKQFAGDHRQMFRVSAATSAAIIGIALVSLHGQGVPGRADDDAVMRYAADDPEWLHWSQCERRSKTLGNTGKPCDLGVSDAAPNFMLWGDSHAMALASSVNRSAARNGLAGELAIASGCPPLSRVVRQDRRHCDAFNAGVLEYLAASDDIGTVILAARWTFIVNGDHRKPIASGALELIDLQDTPSAAAGNAGAFEAGLRRTVARLQELGKDVVLVGPVPEVGYDVPSATHVALKTDRDVDALISPSLAEHEERHRQVLAVFDAIQHGGTSPTILHPAAYLCERGTCRAAIDGAPLYRDDNHLSTAGSNFLAPMFDEVFRQLAPRLASAEYQAAELPVPHEDLADQ